MGLPNDSDFLASSTAGFPCENTEVKLVDKNGKIVPIGEEGELCVRGYGVTLGYYGEPEKTLEVLEQSRWFHTGFVNFNLYQSRFLSFSQFLTCYILHVCIVDEMQN